jgi:hypothetical protein
MAWNCHGVKYTATSPLLCEVNTEVILSYWGANGNTCGPEGKLSATRHDWKSDADSVRVRLLQTGELLSYTDLVHIYIGRQAMNLWGWKIRSVFFVIPFCLQSVQVHSANCVKMYTMACRRGLSSALLTGRHYGCCSLRERDLQTKP